jgi:hypothetical protein
MVIGDSSLLVKAQDPSKTKMIRVENIRWLLETETRRYRSPPTQGRNPMSANLMRGASMVEWFLSRRDSTIVARHEVPG